MTDELRFDRLISADRETVFDLFTSPAGQIAFYQGPEPGWLIRSECDLREGGAWTVEFGPSADAMYQHRNVFKVIERPRRLCTRPRKRVSTDGASSTRPRSASKNRAPAP
jgi:uncharacterized protein YndB with AHSA1/START domain